MKLKKLLAGVCALTMVAALSACTLETTDSESSKIESSAAESKVESSESSVESSEESSEEETEAAEFTFAINSTSLGKDYEDKDVLIIKYDFTNNSDEATSFTFACQDTVFQDGIECDSTVIGCDDIDSQEQLNDIQPGKTYTVTVGYHISDMSKPVDVVVTDLFGKETLLEESIDLSTL